MPNGLNLYVKRDGTWIEFVSRSGKRSAIRIETLADERYGGIIAMTLREWCQDRQAEHAQATSESGGSKD